jgi:hypothetical protein
VIGEGEPEVREKALAKTEPSMLVISEDVVDTYMKTSHMLTTKFKEWLIPEVDFTTKIFGKGKRPTLLDPGAGKLIGFFACRPRHRVLERIYDKDEEGYESIRYVIATEIVQASTGKVVAEGVGSCSSDEVKYKYRWFFASKLESMGISQDERHKLPTRITGGGKTQYRARNPEIPDLDNTILKMASKRSEVDGCLQLPGVAAVFTQDVGDYKKPEAAPSENGRKEVQAEQGQPSGNGVPLKSLTPAGVMDYLAQNIPSLTRGDLDIRDAGGAIEVYPKKHLDYWKAVCDLVDAEGGEWIDFEGNIDKDSHWWIPRQDEPQEPPQEMPPTEEAEPEEGETPKGSPRSIEDVKERLEFLIPEYNDLVKVTEYADYYRIGRIKILNKETENHLDFLVKEMGGEFNKDKNEWRIEKT